MSSPTYADITAGVRATIGAHTQAQDAGRTDDVVALYLEDAVLELPGSEPVVGHDALREAFAGWAPVLPQMHLAGNTLVTQTGDGEARALTDVAFFMRGEDGWSVQVVGHYDDTFRLQAGQWLIQRRSTTYQG